jgi:hypothetical protein
MTRPHTARRTLAAALALALFVPCLHAEAADNVRRDWYKKYDYNNDGQLKGKEARTFRKDKEKQHGKLQAWCEKAKEKPKKFDVKIPKDVKEKKVKCKKHHIDAPYIKAWVRAGAPEPETPSRDGARVE